MGLPSSELFAARHERGRQALQRAALDALLVTHLPNIRYLTGFGGSTAAVVLARERLVFVTDARYVTEVAQELVPACPGLELVRVDPTYDETLVRVLMDLEVRRVGIEASRLVVQRHAWLTSTLAARASAAGEPRVELAETDRLIEADRLVKDAFEQAALRTAGRMLTGVAQEIVADVRAGRTESAIAADIDWTLKHAGFERPAFDTIVASGSNAALPHARPGARVLEAGDLVVLDFGGVYDGYCVDLTRTVCVGEAGIETRRVYDAVAQAQAAAIAMVAPGTKVSDVDAAARDTLARFGLADAFTHATGHGLGLEVHEEPRVGPAKAGIPGVAPAGRDEILAPGMVITVEPGAYLPGWGGVRIEDDVLVTADGREVLTSATRALQVV